MTLPIFPELPGIDIAQSMRPEIHAEVKKNPLNPAVEKRLRFQRYPIYTIKISLNALFETADENEIMDMMGFIVDLGGPSLPFLYRNPKDYRVVKQDIGIGDGSRTAFQLVRKIRLTEEPVQQPMLDTVSIYIDDAIVDPETYTVSEAGIVTFDNPPGNNAAIAWSGQYFYRVRLLEDGYDFITQSISIASCEEIGFVGSVRAIIV